MHSEAELLRAYQTCAEVTRSCARNFYYGLRLTPEPRRSAIFSVYAWMRRADDQVDTAADLPTKSLRLAEFSQATERLIAGEPLGAVSDDPVWVAFRQTILDYHLDPADLRRLLKGLETDLDAERRAAGSDHPILICDTRDALREYCYCVASTVGLICVAIWGLRDPSLTSEARRLAVERGQAFQLTNILRDFAQDYDEGRVYLPAADFQRARLSAESLRRWSDPQTCEAFVRDLAAHARAHYEASAPLDNMITPSCVAALSAMTRIYSGLLTVIERQPERIVSGGRIRLPSARKATIAIGALVRSLTARRFGRAS
jgi:phytoene synthase